MDSKVVAQAILRLEAVYKQCLLIRYAPIRPATYYYLRRRFTANRRFQRLVSEVTEVKVPETGQKLYLEPNYGSL